MLQGPIVSSPRDGKDTDRPRVNISASERAAVEAMACKLPAWAVDSGLYLQSVEGESKLTTVVRAFAHGMFCPEPPQWLQPGLFKLQIEVSSRHYATAILILCCVCVQNCERDGRPKHPSKKSRQVIFAC